ncbi:MAG: response regulator [Cytophagales bacterium]|nr:response regulator [Cytophagales bacterium]
MPKEGSFLSPLRNKILAAFILAAVAIALAVATTYVGFNSLLTKVDELTIPNDKLRALNHLFEQITKLDQQQRADAIRNPTKSSRTILSESRQLNATLDSLVKMTWSNPRQSERLEAMKRILSKRDYLLVEYLRLRSEFIANSYVTQQLDSLSYILELAQKDSTVSTQQKKTTTTTYIPEERKSNFFNRLFGSRKKDTTEQRVEIKEEILTQTDTLAKGRQAKARDEVERIMKRLDEDKRLQTTEMLERELRLINANMVLINQLLSILREVETEELALFERKNEEAGDLVNSSVERISYILIIFFLVTAALVFLILLDLARSNYYRLQLTHAKEEAERLSQVKQRFLANMSHEIRTPLQSILGFAEQLNHQKNNEEALKAIQRSAEHLLHIVDEVLDYSRIESGQLVLQQQSFWLDELADEVATVVQVQAQKKNLEFAIEINTIDFAVMGDAFRLKQVLFNLLGNAIKFTASGKVTLALEIISQTDTQAVVQFLVTDTGKGIPKEEQQKIFDQYDQGGADIHKQYGGTGLGLSIVKRIIEEQKGSITVASEPGKGTTFCVTLTFEKTTAAMPVATPVAQHSTFKEHVWLVDDDPLILKLCSLILHNHGITHTAIQHPEQILKKEIQPEDAVFMDIRMPGVNGIDLCKQLRTRLPQLYIVALTAHIVPSETKSLLESGFSRILPKPFREQELLEALHQIAHRIHAHTNLNELERITQGDQSLMSSIVEEFVIETRKNLLDLEKRMLDKDRAGVREIIHQVAGRVGQLGARPLMKELQRIELLLVNGTSPGEIRELPAVIEQVRAFKVELAKEFETR